MVRPLIIPGEAPLNIVEQVKIFVSLIFLFSKKKRIEKNSITESLGVADFCKLSTKKNLREFMKSS